MTDFKGTASSDAIGGTSSGDRIWGLSGNDSLYGFGGWDKLYGGAGNDYLYGGDGKDELYGGEGDDVLSGGAGDDLLKGGPGSDTYYGGEGLDRFIFSDVPQAGSTVERIKDFGFGELLDLSAIDANWNRDGNQTFDFNGRASQFTGRAGEVRYQQFGESGGEQSTVIYLDVEGDRVTDMFIVIEDFRINLQDHNFIL